MNLIINESGLTFKSLMKVIFVGYTIGASILFIPFVALDLIASEQSVSKLGILILIPVIIMFQAVIFGLLINLGIYIYKRLRPIAISNA